MGARAGRPGARAISSINIAARKEEVSVSFVVVSVSGRAARTRGYPIIPTPTRAPTASGTTAAGRARSATRDPEEGTGTSSARSAAIARPGIASRSSSTYARQTGTTGKRSRTGIAATFSPEAPTRSFTGASTGFSNTGTATAPSIGSTRWSR